MKLAADKQVIDRLRRLRRWIRRHLPTKEQSTAVLTVTVAACVALLAVQKQLGLTDTVVGLTYVISAVATAALRLATREAVDEALHTPAPPDTDETQPTPTETHQ